MSEIRVDTISEKTSANGVSIDGLTIKDGGITATTGAIVFNEASADVDFRVESNGNANMLFVDGGNDSVGVGTGTPAKLVHIVGAADNGILEGIQIDNTDHASTETGQAVAINLRLSQAGTMRDAGRITIGKDDDWDDAAATDSHITFKTMTSNTLTEHMRIDSAGKVGIGINDPVQALEVRGQIGISASGTGSKFLGFYSSDTLSSFIEKNGDNLTLYNVDAGEIRLATNDAEQVRIHSNGVVSATAGVALGVGTANTASNVLDDYEEGTFTPIFVSDAGAGAYNIQDGDYTKVGDLVHICINLSISTIGSFAGAFIQVNGLPFTSENVNTSGNILSTFINAAASDFDRSYFRIPNNASTGRLEKSNGVTGTDNSANANHIDTGTTVCITGTYKAA